MEIGYILPMSIVMGILSYSLLAIWYVMPKLLTLTRKTSLILLMFPHTFRYIGMGFLIHGVTSSPLDPRFAIPAAYGDLLAAVLALAAIVALRWGLPGKMGLVWIFNTVGTIDLFNAVYQGFRHVPDAHFGAMYLIPALIVPLLVVTHFMIFALLLKKEHK